MPDRVRLQGRAALEAALSVVGERLALAGEPCAIVVLGGAAMNLLGIVDRPTVDVDILARADASGAIHPPDPLPQALTRAAAAVARDRGFLDNWMNTTVADQWRFGLPDGLADRVAWRTFGALRVGIVGRRDLVAFKLYASADQTGPDNVHVRDLLALRPDEEELAWAGTWARAQDPDPEFGAIVDQVIAYVHDALR
jgi:hypothetical protein